MPGWCKSKTLPLQTHTPASSLSLITLKVSPAKEGLQIECQWPYLWLPPGISHAGQWHWVYPWAHWSCRCILHITSKSSFAHDFSFLLKQAPSLMALPPKCGLHLLHYSIKTGSTDLLAASRHLLTEPRRFASWSAGSIGICDSFTLKSPTVRSNLVLAWYAVSLIWGKTITGVGICHATLMGYVNQAWSPHDNYGLSSPCLADINYIKIVVKK
jgi:hypothetical protein